MNLCQYRYHSVNKRRIGAASRKEVWLSIKQLDITGDFHPLFTLTADGCRKQLLIQEFQRDLCKHQTHALMSKLEERQTESYHVEIFYPREWGRGRNSDMGWILFTEGSNLVKQSLQAPGYFRHRLACAVFSLFFFLFFLDSQTPWKRKPSERMMGTEGHCGFKHTYGHSPICLPHNLLCWQTKQS